MCVRGGGSTTQVCFDDGIGAIDRLYYRSSPNVVFTVDNVKPYYTVNKILVPEWPTIIDVRSFTASYKW